MTLSSHEPNGGASSLAVAPDRAAVLLHQAEPSPAGRGGGAGGSSATASTSKQNSTGTVVPTTTTTTTAGVKNIARIPIPTSNSRRPSIASGNSSARSRICNNLLNVNQSLGGVRRLSVHSRDTERSGCSTARGGGSTCHQRPDSAGHAGGTTSSKISAASVLPPPLLPQQLSSGQITSVRKTSLQSSHISSQFSQPGSDLFSHSAVSSTGTSMWYHSENFYLDDGGAGLQSRLGRLEYQNLEFNYITKNKLRQLPPIYTTTMGPGSSTSSTTASTASASANQNCAGANAINKATTVDRPSIFTVGSSATKRHGGFFQEQENAKYVTEAENTYEYHQKLLASNNANPTTSYLLPGLIFLNMLVLGIETDAHADTFTFSPLFYSLEVFFFLAFSFELYLRLRKDFQKESEEDEDEMEDERASTFSRTSGTGAASVSRKSSESRNVFDNKSSMRTSGTSSGRTRGLQSSVYSQRVELTENWYANYGDDNHDEDEQEPTSDAGADHRHLEGDRDHHARANEVVAISVDQMNGFQKRSAFLGRRKGSSSSSFSGSRTAGDSKYRSRSGDEFMAEGPEDELYQPDLPGQSPRMNSSDIIRNGKDGEHQAAAATGPVEDSSESNMLESRRDEDHGDAAAAKAASSSTSRMNSNSASPPVLRRAGSRIRKNSIKEKPRIHRMSSTCSMPAIMDHRDVGATAERGQCDDFALEEQQRGQQSRISTARRRNSQKSRNSRVENSTRANAEQEVDNKTDASLRKYSSLRSRMFQSSEDLGENEIDNLEDEEEEEKAARMNRRRAASMLRRGQSFIAKKPTSMRRQMSMCSNAGGVITSSTSRRAASSGAGGGARATRTNSQVFARNSACFNRPIAMGMARRISQQGRNSTSNSTFHERDNNNGGVSGAEETSGADNVSRGTTGAGGRSSGNGTRRSRTSGNLQSKSTMNLETGSNGPSNSKSPSKLPRRRTGSSLFKSRSRGSSFTRSKSSLYNRSRSNLYGWSGSRKYYGSNRNSRFLLVAQQLPQQMKQSFLVVRQRLTQISRRITTTLTRPSRKLSNSFVMRKSILPAKKKAKNLLRGFAVKAKQAWTRYSVIAQRTILRREKLQRQNTRMAPNKEPKDREAAKEILQKSKSNLSSQTNNPAATTSKTNIKNLAVQQVGTLPSPTDSHNSTATYETNHTQNSQQSCSTAGVRSNTTNKAALLKNNQTRSYADHWNSLFSLFGVGLPQSQKHSTKTNYSGDTDKDNTLLVRQGSKNSTFGQTAVAGTGAAGSCGDLSSTSRLLNNPQRKQSVFRNDSLFTQCSSLAHQEAGVSKVSTPNKRKMSVLAGGMSCTLGGGGVVGGNRFSFLQNTPNSASKSSNWAVPQSFSPENQIMMNKFNQEMIIEFFEKKKGNLLQRLTKIEDPYWVLFDLSIILAAGLELVLAGYFHTTHTEKTPSRARCLEVLRTLSLLRILRFLKLLHFSKELLLVSRGLVVALSTISWILILLLLFLYVNALFLVRFIGQDFAEDMRRNDGSLSPHACQIAKDFGTVTQAIYHLFVVFTLEEWPVIAEPFRQELGSGFGWYFVAFIMVTNFIVFSLVIAMALQNIKAIKQIQELRLLQSLSMQKNHLKGQLVELFRHCCSFEKVCLEHQLAQEDVVEEGECEKNACGATATSAAPPCAADHAAENPQAVVMCRGEDTTVERADDDNGVEARKDKDQQATSISGGPPDKRNSSNEALSTTNTASADEFGNDKIQNSTSNLAKDIFKNERSTAGCCALAGTCSSSSSVSTSMNNGTTTSGEQQQPPTLSLQQFREIITQSNTARFEWKNVLSSGDAGSRSNEDNKDHYSASPSVPMSRTESSDESEEEQPEPARHVAAASTSNAVSSFSVVSAASKPLDEEGKQASAGAASSPKKSKQVKNLNARNPVQLKAYHKKTRTLVREIQELLEHAQYSTTGFDLLGENSLLFDIYESEETKLTEHQFCQGLDTALSSEHSRGILKCQNYVVRALKQKFIVEGNGKFEKLSNSIRELKQGFGALDRIAGDKNVKIADSHGGSGDGPDDNDDGKHNGGHSSFGLSNGERTAGPANLHLHDRATTERPEGQCDVLAGKEQTTCENKQLRPAASKNSAAPGHSTSHHAAVPVPAGGPSSTTTPTSVMFANKNNFCEHPSLEQPSWPLFREGSSSSTSCSTSATKTGALVSPRPPMLPPPSCLQAQQANYPTTLGTATAAGFVPPQLPTVQQHIVPGGPFIATQITTSATTSSSSSSFQQVSSQAVSFSNQSSNPNNMDRSSSEPVSLHSYSHTVSLSGASNSIVTVPTPATGSPTVGFNTVFHGGAGAPAASTLVLSSHQVEHLATGPNSYANASALSGVAEQGHSSSCGTARQSGGSTTAIGFFKAVPPPPPRPERADSLVVMGTTAGPTSANANRLCHDLPGTIPSPPGNTSSSDAASTTQDLLEPHMHNNNPPALLFPTIPACPSQPHVVIAGAAQEQQELRAETTAPSGGDELVVVHDMPGGYSAITSPSITNAGGHQLEDHDPFLDACFYPEYSVTVNGEDADCSASTSVGGGGPARPAQSPITTLVAANADHNGEDRAAGASSSTSCESSSDDADEESFRACSDGEQEVGEEDTTPSSSVCTSRLSCDVDDDTVSSCSGEEDQDASSDYTGTSSSSPCNNSPTSDARGPWSSDFSPNVGKLAVAGDDVDGDESVDNVEDAGADVSHAEMEDEEQFLQQQREQRDEAFVKMLKKVMQKALEDEVQ
ncbi:unnamed protein product [Amoebophrya sp. A120]|nr:unnamed protein product [Amoebophrya sp. A120]|eukprot:GSA120T00014354001.1